MVTVRDKNMSFVPVTGAVTNITSIFYQFVIAYFVIAYMAYKIE